MCHTIEKLHLTGIKILNDVAGLSTQRARIKQLQQLPLSGAVGDSCLHAGQEAKLAEVGDVGDIRNPIAQRHWLTLRPIGGSAGIRVDQHAGYGVDRQRVVGDVEVIGKGIRAEVLQDQVARPLPLHRLELQVSHNLVEIRVDGHVIHAGHGLPSLVKHGDKLAASHQIKQ